jgi:hypothetical protein
LDAIKKSLIPDSAIDMLMDRYKDIMGDPKDDALKVRAVIVEYAELLEARGLNGADVVHSKIEAIGRKPSKDKRTVNYLIGCLRNVVENGPTSTGSQSETRLIAAFQSTYNIQLTLEGKEKLLSLMTRFGVSEILFMLLENKEPVEDLIILGVESILCKAQQ